uniref:Uncharacterized protein n=1 Tax=Ciona intestinalis TaxID=7719 RepID=H2XQW9_CIOIN
MRKQRSNLLHSVNNINKYLRRKKHPVETRTRLKYGSR